MIPGFSICDLIHTGGVHYNISGNSLKEIYIDICNQIPLPPNYDKEIIINELFAREEILSTAVGNGVSIPHPRHPIIKNTMDQRLAVCFLKEPLDMNAPDGRKVSVMFVLLSSSSQFHLHALSQLATLIKDSTFRKVLEKKPTEQELLLAIKNAGL